jgi:hypothetical protein
MSEKTRVRGAGAELNNFLLGTNEAGGHHPADRIIAQFAKNTFSGR